MLTVKIQYGDDMERLFYVNDLQDVKRVSNNLMDDFQKVLEESKSEERIELERLIDKSPCEDADGLSDWINRVCDICDGDTGRLEELAGIYYDLQHSDYDSVEDLLDRVRQLEECIDNIYYEVQDMR